MAGALIGALRVTLGIDATQFEDGVKGATRHAKMLEKELKATGERMVSVGKTMTMGITLPVAAFAVHAAKAASDAEELRAAFGETFGDMTKAMEDWARTTGDAMGRSTQEIMEGAQAFGLYFNQAAKTREEAAEMSKSFTILAQDLSSFHNTSVPDALLALRSGLSGETEPLRRYGVFLNEAAVKAKALEMGLKPLGKEFTDQQKIMARYQIIMDATKNAQGDVMRTSDSASNRARALKAAWEELTVAVGEKLLPILTPLLEMATKLLNKFGELSPETQKWIMIVGGIAAVLGPVIWAMGTIVTNAGVLIRLLPAMGAAAAAGGAGATAGAGGLTALGVALRGMAVVLGPVALAIGAVWLAWQNWDKIAPILSSIGGQLKATFGPTIISAFNTLKATLLDLWQGPLGQSIRDVGTNIMALGAIIGELWRGPLGNGIKAVGGVLLDFGVVIAKVMGATTIALINGVITTFAELLAQIGRVVNLVVALFRGDWSAAWGYAKEIVVGAVNGFLNILDEMVPGATASIKKLYNAVKEWLLNGLGKIFDQVKQKVTAVGDWFYEMYDRVVGHSYVPDMVEGIAKEMAKLDQLMVAPVKKGTEKVAEAFKDLIGEVQPILDRLFPDAAALRKYRNELAALDKAMDKKVIDRDTYLEAKYQLEKERAEATQIDVTYANGDKFEGGPLETVELTWEKWQQISKQGKENVKRDNDEVIVSYAEMARDVVGSLRSMVSSFKSGDILGGIQGILDMVTQVVNVVRMVKGLPSVGSTTSTRSATGFSTGGSFKVGGSGGIDSQLVQFRASPGEMVDVRRGDQMRGGGAVHVFVTKGEMFDAHVERVAAPLADQAAIRGAMGGAAKARMDGMRANRGRLA